MVKFKSVKPTAGILTIFVLLLGCVHHPVPTSPANSRQEQLLGPTMAGKIACQDRMSAIENQTRSLIADKEDLIKQKHRLEAEVKDFQDKAAANTEQTRNLIADKEDLIRQKQRLELEVQDFQKKLNEQSAYAGFLEQFRLPTIERITKSGFHVLAQNNTVLKDFKKIRAIKHRANNLRQLWQELTPYAASHQQFHDARDRAIGAMLVVAAFYDFGNPPPDETLPGCVSNNVKNEIKADAQLTFAAHMESDIGCCTDFTMMLGSFLKHLGYKREVLISPAHQCLRVEIDGRWHLLDATALVFSDSYFSDQVCDLYYYTPNPDARTIRFQHFVIKALALKIEPYRLSDWQIISVEQNNLVYRSGYLDAEER